MLKETEIKETIGFFVIGDILIEGRAPSPDYAYNDELDERLKTSITQHLQSLETMFKRYFPKLKKQEAAFVRNPFSTALNVSDIPDQCLREGGTMTPGPMGFRGPFKEPMGLKGPINGLNTAYRNDTDNTVYGRSKTFSFFFFFGDHLKIRRKLYHFALKTFFVWRSHAVLDWTKPELRYI